MSAEPADPDRTEETEAADFALLDGCWEALQRGEKVDPEQWSRSQPGGEARRAQLRVLKTLHQALQMVREDSQAAPVDPHATLAHGGPGPACTAEQDADLPRVLGGYTLLQRLGGGGMGAVYEAEERATGRRVAVKLIAPHFHATTESVERFRREGRLASMIAHPRCVFVLAAEEDAGQPYIVMELMPGTTLKDLVERQGPLPQEEAVRLILDVIDGLLEAHRLQVLHRDVKPANCFLDENGNVKIGDFGLSKSLGGNASLTQAGAFLGTVHYAAPEQFRGPAAVDLRCDVYAVAATLYYLLIGQPPFPDAEPATVVARKASESAPPLRSLRRDVSPALERVVLRGLERDRERRWRDLRELRQALLPFLPDQLAAAGLGMRVGAYLIDTALFIQAAAVTSFFDVTGVTSLLGGLGGVVLEFLAETSYFVALEGWWGGSIGKQLLRLRVLAARGNEPPGLGRVLVRTLLFEAAWIPWMLAAAGADPRMLLMLPLSVLLAVALIASTMRDRNGYRGLHEMLSGTRVVQLPGPERQRSFACPAEDKSLMPAAAPVLPRHVGPFAVQRALAWEGETRILLGEDESLKRRVWIQLRAGSEPAMDLVRRELNRRTRLRWLAGGEQGEQHWDAFLAPLGCSLVQLLAERPPLPWRDVRPILEQLADELCAAQRDGTLPAVLTVGQVWVQPDGRAQLLDSAAGGSDVAVAPLELLRHVAALALEGRLRAPEQPAWSIRAPLPLHAARLLDRLLGVDSGYATVEEFQAGLVDTHDQPVEITADWRAAQLAVLGGFVLLGLFWIFGVARFATFMARNTLDEQLATIDAWRRILAVERFDADLAAHGPDWLKDPGAVRARLEERLVQVRSQLAEADLLLKASVGIVVGLGGGETSEPDPAENPVALRHNPGEEPTVEVTWQGPSGERTDRYSLDGVHRLVQGDGPVLEALPYIEYVFLAMLGLVPILWVFWSLLFRGGWTLRLMGMALVRACGRKALRLQCAWRTLLAWAPITGLLFCSCWFDWQTWSTAGQAGIDGPAAWLALATWWLAVAVLAAQVLHACRRPRRALHDMLSGTYLVPR